MIIDGAIQMATSLLKTIQERPGRATEDAAFDMAALVFALTGIITVTCRDDDDDRKEMLEEAIRLRVSVERSIAVRREKH
jgi:hypothetical protein